MEKNKVKVMKYYLMDWDDNIMYMPTKIHLLDENGEDVKMSTHDFAHYREMIDSHTKKTKDPNGFEYNGHTIVGLADDAFRDFSSGSDKFIRDIQKGKPGPAWHDLVEALNSGSLFAIITARGHSPETLKDGVKFLIENEAGGISKTEIINSLKLRKSKAKEEYTSDEEEIENYLNMCLFYPVAHFYKGASLKPEEIKRDAIIKYKNEITSMVDSLNDKMRERGELEYILKPVFGFSDDDLKNVEYSTQIPGVNIYSTHGGTKKLRKKAEEPTPDEVSIEKKDEEKPKDDKLNEEIKRILKLIKN